MTSSGDFLEQRPVSNKALGKRPQSRTRPPSRTRMGDPTEDILHAPSTSAEYDPAAYAEEDSFVRSLKTVDTYGGYQNQSQPFRDYVYY